MGKFLQIIVKYLAFSVVVLLIVSVIIFSSVELLPGDYPETILEQPADVEMVVAMRKDLGLDRTAIVRYQEWLTGILRGDFGISLASKRNVIGLIRPRFYNTLFLAIYAATIAIPISIGLGIVTAIYWNRVFDRIVNVIAITSISSPEFFTGYFLVFLLAMNNDIFPAISTLSDGMSLSDKLFRTFLPALTLILVISAHMIRMTRTVIINLLASPYIEMARLKGIPDHKVILHHALPNALAPIFNVMALNMAYLITGVVQVEVVFSYPGIGQLLVDSVTNRDYPVTQACSLIFAATFIVFNLLADIGSILSNPRLSHPSYKSL